MSEKYYVVSESILEKLVSCILIAAVDYKKIHEASRACEVPEWSTHFAAKSGNQPELDLEWCYEDIKRLSIEELHAYHRAMLEIAKSLK